MGNNLAQTDGDGRSGESVRQHMRQMLLRLMALQRQREEEQKNQLSSVDTATEVEGENDAPRGVRDLKRPT